MVFAIAINQGYLNLVILGVVTSLIGVFYYFRVIVAIYFKEPSPGTLTLSLSTKVLLAVLMMLSLGMGVFPNLVLVL